MVNGNNAAKCSRCVYCEYIEHQIGCIPHTICSQDQICCKHSCFVPIRNDSIGSLTYGLTDAQMTQSILEMKQLAKEQDNSIYGSKAFGWDFDGDTFSTRRMPFSPIIAAELDYGTRIKKPIKKVIFNDPATIVMWSDGTKTVVKCGEDDDFDKEKGLAMAISKKMLGNKGSYYDTFKEWCVEEEVSLDAGIPGGLLDEMLSKVKEYYVEPMRVNISNVLTKEVEELRKQPITERFDVCRYCKNRSRCGDCFNASQYEMNTLTKDEKVEETAKL